jgi:anti-anti-sigma regulatory factor
MPPRLTLTRTAIAPGMVQLSLNGRLDGETAEPFGRTWSLILIQPNLTSVVLDLAELTDLDYDGVYALHAARLRAQELTISLTIINCPPHIEPRLRSTGLLGG